MKQTAAETQSFHFAVYDLPPLLFDARITYQVLMSLTVYTNFNLKQSILTTCLDTQVPSGDYVAFLVTKCTAVLCMKGHEDLL